MDWPRVREILKKCRETAHLSQVGLARAIGVNKSTINRIENVYGEPQHTPDLSTIDRWVAATGSTLTSFFAQVEIVPPTPEVAADEALPAFESEERIAQRVLQRLADYALKRSPPKRPADYRLPATARPIAAERSPHARRPRKRNVSGKKKRRQRRKPDPPNGE